MVAGQNAHYLDEKVPVPVCVRVCQAPTPRHVTPLDCIVHSRATAVRCGAQVIADLPQVIADLVSMLANAS